MSVVSFLLAESPTRALLRLGSSPIMGSFGAPTDFLVSSIFCSLAVAPTVDGIEAAFFTIADMSGPFAPFGGGALVPLEPAVMVNGDGVRGAGLFFRLPVT